jgi:feruloyl esterase
LLAALAMQAHARDTGPGPARCSGLAATAFPETRITLAQFNAATDTLPEHCEVIGAIDERIGTVDGQAYAVRFHLRMPTAWNKRLLFQGGGGTDGALGNADAGQIRDGYAVASTDSGHDNQTNTSPLAGTFQFAFDPQARSDYGYRGPALAAHTAKSVMKKYYGHAPKRSYFTGCSEGGREGLMLSQRFPELFDGIVSGNPGMDLPKAAIAEAWDSQAFAAAARSTTPFGNPDLASSFTNAELAAVGDAILAECDAKDGLADGMVFNPSACDFDPATLGPEGSGALSAAQVTALEKVFDGARNSRGKALYAGWFWDPGIAASGWRIWKIGPLFPAPGNTALNTTLGGGALPFIFTTPPNSATGGTALHGSTTITSAGPNPGFPGLNDAFVPWVLSFNMDSDAPKIFASHGPYAESAMDFMGTSSTDYRRFRKSGGKLIVYTGQADPVFSARYHLRWYRKLIARNDGLHQTRKFARMFFVPGMNHCGGGPSTSQFDAFAAVVDWVEKGKAPESLIGTAPAGTPWPGRTRPLCAYPEQARYKGEGSIEDAVSFSCEIPRHDHHGRPRDDDD